MTKTAAVACGLILISTLGGVCAEAQVAMPPAPVLMIQREYVKPGKGALHEKTESLFVSAMAAAKWPVYYVAATSLSGPNRALFFVGYPTFEAWEKDNRAYEKNPALTATLDKTNAADGELLTSSDTGVFTLDPEISLRPGEMVHARYFEIEQFHVKPGHRQEFMAVAKMYRDAFEKVSPQANWAMYESAYGQGNVFLAISMTKSLAEDDKGMMEGAKLPEAMGAEAMKKAVEMTAACLESQDQNLFSLNSKMSYASPEWIKADDFWKPKAAAKTMPVKKAATPATP